MVCRTHGDASRCVEPGGVGRMVAADPRGTGYQRQGDVSVGDRRAKPCFARSSRVHRGYRAMHGCVAGHPSYAFRIISP